MRSVPALTRLNTPSDQLVCTVNIGRILYPRGGFTPGDFAILACDILDVQEGEPYQTDTIVAKGRVFSCDFGMTYTLHGSLYKDDKYGYCYKIDKLQEQMDLENTEDRDAYLHVVLTPMQYRLLTQAFSSPDALYDLLDKGEAEPLTKVKSIGPATAKRILDRFAARKEEAKAFAALSKYGLSVDAIASLLKRAPNADALVQMVEADPYLMIDTIDGIGWARADAIALKGGMSPQDPRRVSAYVKNFFHLRAEAGHTWCYPQEIWDALSYDLKLTDQTLLRNALYGLHDKGVLWWDDNKQRIALTELRDLEERIAGHLYRLAQAPSLPAEKGFAAVAKAVQEQSGIVYTPEQAEAIRRTLAHNVSIITGPAGTGKSTVVRGVLEALGDKEVAQCALSGRAAARLTEVTGMTGSTIHRLLGWQPGEGFTFNKESPLPYDVIILDEISMVGAEIFCSLLEAIPTGAKLIMLGDDGQLESIGLCNLFRDMLDSRVVPASVLTKIHRQAARSAIITESMKVRQQVSLIPRNWVGEETRGELQDLTLRVFGDSLLTRDTILDAYQGLLGQGISKDDIQIVVPMRTRGEACALKINRAVQEIVNPKHGAQEIVLGKDTESYTLRSQDRIICTRNLYKAAHPPEAGEEEGENCPVYNGDRGVILSISPDHMLIHFDLWGVIDLPKKYFQHIELGYALSCHKLQGSEAPYVIVGFDMSSAKLLTKEWLYTAITRAKKRCIICAESRALSYAGFRSNVPLKRTFLKELLLAKFSTRKE